jgi:lysophospholipase L1-like esterase
MSRSSIPFSPAGRRLPWLLSAKVLLLAVAAGLCGAGLRGAAMAQEPAAARVAAAECRPRGGLPAFLAKARAGGELKVAFLGGSITAAPGWRVLSLERLRREFPRATFAEINAAIGGTGSDLGAFRVGHDVLAHRPDLVFVEFAVNDAGGQPERVMATMEGIVRQVRRADPATDICFVYTLSEPLLTDLARGDCPRAAAAMEAVADHYAIPSLHFGVDVARRIADKTLIFKGEKPETPDSAAVPMVFSTDGVHPLVETGHALYGEIFTRAFAAIVAATPAAAASPSPRPLPAPLRADNWEQARMVPIEQGMLAGPWRRVTPADDERARAFAGRMPVLWKAEGPGASLSVAFRGTLLSIYDLVGPGAGTVSVQVDDTSPRDVPRIDGYCTSWRIAQLSVGSLPAGAHRATFTLADTKPDKAAILFEKNRGDLAAHPEKYAEQAWYASAILLLGELVAERDASSAGAVDAAATGSATAATAADTSVAVADAPAAADPVVEKPAAEPPPPAYRDPKPQAYHLQARASELDPRAKPHPEIDFVFEKGGKPADVEHATVDTRVPPRGRLVVWLMNYNEPLFQRLNSYGLHAVQPHYANQWFAKLPPHDRMARGNVRLEASIGEDVSDQIDIPRPDAMTERVRAMLKALVKTHPQGRWEQFLTRDGGKVRWEKVIISGASHGATTAARFAKHTKVDRVVMLCGPRDQDQDWQSIESATAGNRYFGFSHVLDGGWSGDHYCRSWELLGMNRYGPIVDVDTTPAPFGNSRRLVSAADVGGNADKAHGAVQPGGSSPKGPDGKLLYEDVWKYLYTHPVDEVGKPVPADPDCRQDHPLGT